jgi:hypothetical protein
MNLSSHAEYAPFVTDPEAVAASWYAHAKGSEERAVLYREWARAAKTGLEKARWLSEAEKQDDQAAFAHQKHMEWLETIHA